MFGSRSKIIVNLLGPTGSGKGTQGNLLSECLQIPHISLGDIFRSEMNSTSLGQLIKHHLSMHNSLVPDEIAYGLLTKRLSKGDCLGGFIIEGFPITLEQSKFLFSFILNSDDCYIPIELRVSAEVSNTRLKRRRICYLCSFQVAINELKDTAVCPNCNNITLGRRLDDKSKEQVQDKRNRYYDHIDSISKEISSVGKLFVVEQFSETSKVDVLNNILAYIEEQKNVGGSWKPGGP